MNPNKNDWNSQLAHAGILLLAIFIPKWLPLCFGVRWIPGWPTAVPGLISVALVLALTLLRPQTKAFWRSLTKKQRLGRGLLMTALFLLYISLGAWINSHNAKVVEYLRSPKGKHAAVVMDAQFVEVHPVRAGLFYERKNGTVSSGEYEIFRWIDENTLALGWVAASGEEIFVDYIRW